MPRTSHLQTRLPRPDLTRQHRRCRDPFHRPTHGRAAHQPQKPKFKVIIRPRRVRSVRAASTCRPGELGRLGPLRSRPPVAQLMVSTEARTEVSTEVLFVRIRWGVKCLADYAVHMFRPVQDPVA